MLSSSAPRPYMPNLSRTLFVAALFSMSAQAQVPAPTRSTDEIKQISQQEQRRELDLLHLTAVRTGPSGSAKATNPANYDEAKAGPVTPLPDPLRMNSGKMVTSAAQWWSTRRPELVEIFDREILGRVPTKTPKVQWEVMSTATETASFDDEGKHYEIATVTKHLLGHVDNSGDPAIKVDIELSLTTPAKSAKPLPVMLEMTFRFPPPKPGEPARPVTPPEPGPTWQQQVLERGWGYASIIPTTIQPDNAAGLTEGIIGLCNHGKPRKLDDWGALRAWGWGTSRALDYFATDPAVDAKQVGIEGHSRYGKASLVAMAYDPRFRVGYISSSGTGGAKIYRHDFGERLENVAAPSEFHWMAGNFLKYAADPLHTSDLPIDEHELIALCAPRPLFFGGGATKGDGWADAEGSFLAAVAAGPIYRLLGRKDLETSTYPPIETPVISGDLGFRQHAKGHTPAPNWPTFLTFAARYLHGGDGALTAAWLMPGAGAETIGCAEPRSLGSQSSGCCNDCH